MVHKEQYQRLADALAIERGLYALHIGKIGENVFVYSLMPADSADFNPDAQMLVTVDGDQATVLAGVDAQAVLARTNLREFTTGRAIYKKYLVLVKNGSAIIGEGLGYAQAVVDAMASKAVKPAMLYRYLEIADHYHKKLAISGSNICLI